MLKINLSFDAFDGNRVKEFWFKLIEYFKHHED